MAIASACQLQLVACVPGRRPDSCAREGGDDGNYALAGAPRRVARTSRSLLQGPAGSVNLNILHPTGIRIHARCRQELYPETTRTGMYTYYQ
jgi:hypothetical protein